ncbi:hypothetical protein HYT24_00710 [Candidatus Pacearchaeota archaeon]|nr:hypothetical protein [Candidatus Pacearchaeota archaeon]
MSKRMKKYVKNNPHFQDGIKNPMYGKKPWNYGLPKETDNKVKKLAEIKTEKFRSGEIVKVWLGKKHSSEHRRKNSLAKRGDLNPMKREDVKKKMAKTLKDRWLNDEEFVKNMLKSFKNLKENKFEKDFEKICKESQLPFVYTGNGSFWIGPCISGKRRNPDFKHVSDKKVILLNGDHWHTNEDINEQVKDYENKGYKVLPIWQSNWQKFKEDVIKSVKEFSN